MPTTQIESFFYLYDPKLHRQRWLFYRLCVRTLTENNVVHDHAWKGVNIAEHVGAKTIAVRRIFNKKTRRTFYVHFLVDTVYRQLSTLGIENYLITL